MSIKKGIFNIIGKTIEEVLILEDCNSYPNYHLILSFTDKSCYEFYGEGHIHSTAGLADNAANYPKVFDSCTSKYIYKKKKGQPVKKEI